MDGQRFDNLTRRLAAGTSRRGLLKAALAGLVSGAAGVTATRSVEAATPCTSGHQCPSRRCVDGFCCNTSCTAQCEVCNLPGREGTCSPVNGRPVGNRQACPGTDVCQATCDGVRRTSCAVFPGSGVTCGAATCRDGWQTSYGCGGNGTCHPTTTSCGLFTCTTDGTGCRTSCASNAECVGAAFCADGVCQGDGPLGQACAGPDQCQSGLCVDGVCCVEACDDPCRACNIPGNLGFCADVADGTHCDDGDPCTTGDVCRNGNCHGTLVTCTTPGVCETSPGTCNPQDGACTYPDAPDNTGCGLGRACCGGACTNVTTPSNCGVCSNACDAGVNCVAGSCQTDCGALGQDCCIPGTCDAGLTCVIGAGCRDCGEEGESCCITIAGPFCLGGVTCNSAGTCICVGTSCQPGCGGAGQACCTGAVCNAGLTCVIGAGCRDCGELGEACCVTIAGPFCLGGLTCNAGTCGP